MGMLNGKLAIVTGGGSGIGKAIVRAFAGEGCKVVIAARNGERLWAAADELGKIGPEIIPIPTDVTDEVQVKALFDHTMKRFSQLDILVNNSGTFEGGRVDELSLAVWRKVIDTNLTGAFLCTREAFRNMKDTGGGRIINIGSISAQMPRAHSSAYSTSKFALTGLTKSTAIDGRKFAITCSILHPGNTAVERHAGGRSAVGIDQDLEPMTSTDGMARTVLLMATLPPGANMFEAIVLPVEQPYLGRG